MKQQEIATLVLEQPAVSLRLTDNHGTHIVYSLEGSVLGPPSQGPQFEYYGPEGQFTFNGDEITRLPSRLGLLLTVTLQPDVDAGRLDCTLVLPRVHIPTGHLVQSFKTLAIKAKSRGFVVNPAGADLTYRVVQLSGVAEAVVFPV